MHKKRLIIILLLILTISFIGYYKLKVTIPAKVENHQRLQPNTEFIYYINVSYDGKDELQNTSSSVTLSNIESDYIYVEDKIPEGLTFLGFVTTGDGSIGAISQDETRICLGYVENGVNGLNYNEETNMVSFKVKNLQAGCKLTIGIKTLTPNVDDPNTEIVETRRDFYNYATAKENNEIVKSNIVHAWIGNDTAPTYQVIYEYSGTIPNGVYTPPDDLRFAEGSTINVAPNPSIDNFAFSGWQTTDVLVTNDKFVMPNKTVTFRGYFTENPKHTVYYNISGTSPSNYETPQNKTYYEGNTVSVNNLKIGDIVGKYRFLGWETSDVTIDENYTFTMPDHDVTFTGSFEELKYNVCYEFLNSALTPPNCNSYHKGDEVTLINIDEYLTSNHITTLNRFLGWNKETTFIMPEEDLIISGTWLIVNGYFKPTIEFIDSNESTKKYHDIGDIEDIGIKITNNEDYTLKDVIIKLDNAILGRINYQICDITCTDTTNYSVTNNTLKIYEIPPHSTFESKLENILITFTKNDLGSSINPEISIISAISDNNYVYEIDPNNKDSKLYNMKSKLRICAQSTNNQSFNYHITSPNIDEYDSNYYDSWLTIKSNTCQNIYLSSGTYKIEQIIPQEYNLINVNGAISNNKDNLVVELNETYHIDFINQYQKKGFFHSYGNAINKIHLKIGDIFYVK